MSIAASSGSNPLAPAAFLLLSVPHSACDEDLPTTLAVALLSLVNFVTSEKLNL